MKLRHFIFFLSTTIFLFSFSEQEIESGKRFKIPARVFDIWKEMGVSEWHDTIAVDSFQVTELVTLGEYRKYLVAIKKDSSLKFYQSQFPDSSMCAPDAYVKYVNGSRYDDFPVSGISWDNALNFCKWKTVNANPKDSFSIVYRLPEVSEWVAAYKFLNEKHVDNDFNGNYSDWTLSAKDDTYYDFTHAKMNPSFSDYDYSYWARPNENAVLKRKVSMGNSFLFSQPTLFDFYSWGYYEFHGYAHIGFRCIIKKVHPLIANGKTGNFNYSNWSEEHEFLHRWGLIKQTNLKTNVKNGLHQ